MWRDILKETPGGHMHILALVRLPHRIFSVMVISAPAAFSLLLIWMEVDVHGSNIAIKPQYEPLSSQGRPSLEGSLSLNSPYCGLRSRGHPHPQFSSDWFPGSEGSR